MLANSGTSPILMKNMPKRARSEATITSNGRIIVRPTPTAAPFTAAISGFDSRTSATQSSPRGRPPSPPAVSSPGSRPSSRDWKVSAMSAPAQKPRPAPVTTIAPTSRSCVGALDRVDEFDAHARRPRVQSIRAMQGEQRDLVAPLHADLLVVQGGLPGSGLLAHRAGHRHEANRDDVVHLEARLGAHVDLQRLPVPGLADGNHQPAADAKLLEQGRRHTRRGGGDDDRVEGRDLRPAAVAVAAADVDLREAEPREVVLRAASRARRRSRSSTPRRRRPRAPRPGSPSRCRPRAPWPRDRSRPARVISATM